MNGDWGKKRRETKVGRIKERSERRSFQ